MAVHLFVAVEELNESLDGERFIVDIFDKCEGAHDVAVACFIEPHDNIGIVALFDRDDAFCILPVGDAILAQHTPLRVTIHTGKEDTAGHTGLQVPSHIIVY